MKVSAPSRSSSPENVRYIKRRRNGGPILSRRHTKNSVDVEHYVIFSMNIFDAICGILK